MGKELTVAITTYNRQHELLAVLRSLERQGHYDKYRIVISDNHSDYDVEGWLKSQLSDSFCSIIDIHVHDFNIGGDSNIAWIFQLVKTPWMWLTSDDDIPTHNALEIIFEDIKKNTDLCWIKYSIKGYYPFQDVICDKLSTIFSQFYGKRHDVGELVFMSNNLYNMVEIYDYIGYLPSSARTSISQLLPPFMAIAWKHNKMMFSSNYLVEYNQGGATYNIIYALLNFGNIKYIGLFKNKEDLLAYNKLIWSPIHIHIKYILLEKRFLRREYFKKIIISQYKLLSFRALIFILYFEVLNILPDRILKKLLHQEKEIVKPHQ